MLRYTSQHEDAIISVSDTRILRVSLSYLCVDRVHCFLVGRLMQASVLAALLLTATGRHTIVLRLGAIPFRLEPIGVAVFAAARQL